MLPSALHPPHLKQPAMLSTPLTHLLRQYLQVVQQVLPYQVLDATLI